MIDWYVILFIAITLLIFHMGEFAGHQNIIQYIRIPGKNHVSMGTVSMLFRLLTSTFVFIPIYLTVTGGYLAGIALSAAGTAVLLWFRSRVERLNDELAGYEHVGEWLTARFRGKGRAAILLILFIAGSEGVILSPILANGFMQTAFGVNPVWTSSILAFFVFIFAGMGGAGGLHKIGRWLLFGFFTGIMIIPVVTVLFQGVSSIQQRIGRLPTVSLMKGDLALAVFFFLFFIAGHLFVYYLLSRDLLEVKRKRLKTTISLTAICWSSMPAAVSVMTIYLLSHSRSADLSVLFTAISGSFSSPLLYLLVVSVLSCFAISIGISLYHLTGLLLRAFKREPVFIKGYGVSLVLALVIFFFSHLFIAYLKEIFICYVQIYISLCLPLWVLIRYQVRWGWELSFIISTSATLGIWTSLHIGLLNGISANLGFSGIVLLLSLVRNFRKI